MRKLLIVLGAVVALAIPATAIAVELHDPHVGTSCPDGGTFHFVAPGGGADSLLTVTFSGGGSVVDMPPSKYNKGTAHWTFDASGTIISGSATNADKLVLSDYECDEKKGEPEEPKKP